MNKMAKWLVLTSFLVVAVEAHSANFESSEWQAELAQQMQTQASEAVADVKAEQRSVLKASLNQVNELVVADVQQQSLQHQILAKPTSETEELLVTTRRE